jgi:hypothetical protein
LGLIGVDAICGQLGRAGTLYNFDRGFNYCNGVVNELRVVVLGIHLIALAYYLSWYVPGLLAYSQTAPKKPAMRVGYILLTIFLVPRFQTIIRSRSSQIPLNTF